MTSQFSIDFEAQDETNLKKSEVIVELPQSAGQSVPPIDGDGPREPINFDDDSLESYATKAYLSYGIAVLKGRALPDVSDGQKPVQRRILYAMHELGLTSSSKHVKSARVVGEVLGKFHPHGDTSVYDAMVRQAQDFSLRYPLIDGQGNFGSRDGDSAAAMRYTESRLTKYSELLLSEIDLNTVDFKDNYDGAFREPAVLPARLPMLLLNGASGVAVGMATECPSHNLSEISSLAADLIKNPGLTDDSFYEQFIGPDFPGGGLCITPRDQILAAYREGRGSLALRCSYEFEELSRGQWKLVVKELPHGVSAAKVLEQIEALSNPQIKTGKKVLDPEQQRIKALFLNLIDTVRDESGKDYAVRLVFEPKSSKIDREEFAKTLLAYTSLESTVSINLVSIGLDGRPAQKSLRTMLDEWCSFRLQTVTNRINNRISQIEKRLHILEGRKIAFLNIDRVIAIIRASDNPKEDLMHAFGLSDTQADDILEIRLRQLARLEGFKLDQEIKALKEELESLRDILSSDSSLRDFVSREVLSDGSKYADERRTKMYESERVTLSEAATVNEKITLLLSKKGWIKQRGGHGVDLSAVTFKEGDSLLQAIETESANPINLLASDGRAYSLSVTQIPSGKTDGVPLSSMCDFEQKVKPIALVAGAEKDEFFVCCDAGYGFISNVGALSTRNKAGKAFFTLKDGESLYRPLKLKEYFCCINDTSGKGIAFQLTELRFADKGRGLQITPLKPGEKIIQPQFVSDLNKVPVFIVAKGETRTEYNQFELGARGQKGRVVPVSMKKFDWAKEINFPLSEPGVKDVQ